MHFSISNGGFQSKICGTSLYEKRWSLQLTSFCTCLPAKSEILLRGEGGSTFSAEQAFLLKFLGGCYFLSKNEHSGREGVAFLISGNWLFGEGAQQRKLDFLVLGHTLYTNLAHGTSCKVGHA
jgi:hypothetical protein